MSPRYHEDKRPRMGKTKSGVISFWHPCSVCGLVNAPYGVNVSLRNEEYGEWFCREHLPDEHKTPAMLRRDATPQEKNPE